MFAAGATFNGTANVTATNFNPITDDINLNLPPSQLFDIAQVGTSIVFTSLSGFTLTIANTNLASLNTGNVQIDGAGQFIVDPSGNPGNITTFEGNDIIFGLNGADTIDAGDGANLIFGGTQRADSTDIGDLITSGTGNDRIYGNGGDDTIGSGSGSDIIYGGQGQDVIGVAPLAGQVAIVYGGGGVVDPTGDPDSIVAGMLGGERVAGGVTAYGNGGDDGFSLAADGPVTVEGGRGNDGITVEGDGNNMIRGGRGVDLIVLTGNGNNMVFGGDKADSGDDAADEITFNGGVGVNQFYGNLGNDKISLTAATGTNTVYGGQDDDAITLTDEGNTTAFGGTGADTLTVQNGETNGNIALYGGASAASTASEDDIFSFGAGTFISGNLDIFGGGGNDKVTIGLLSNGSLDIFGGDGQDDVQVGGPVGLTNVKATVSGGAGNDTINLSSLGVGVTSSLRVDGGDDNDTITGTAMGGATLLGGAGADTITGGAGNEVIAGSAGLDTIDLTAFSTDEVHFSATGNSADTLTAFNNLAGGDFLAFLDGAPGSGAVSFVASDNTAGAAGTRFKASDAGKSYFEFSDDGTGTYTDDLGGGRIVANSDNAVIVFNGVDLASVAPGAPLNTINLAGVTNSYVVVINNADVQVYYSSAYDSSFDGTDATLIATLTGAAATFIDFDVTDFGVYA